MKTAYKWKCKSFFLSVLLVVCLLLSHSTVHADGADITAGSYSNYSSGHDGYGVEIKRDQGFGGGADAADVKITSKRSADDDWNNQTALYIEDDYGNQEKHPTFMIKSVHSSFSPDIFPHLYLTDDYFGDSLILENSGSLTIADDIYYDALTGTMGIGTSTTDSRLEVKRTGSLGADEDKADVKITSVHPSTNDWNNQPALYIQDDYGTQTAKKASVIIEGVNDDGGIYNNVLFPLLEIRDTYYGDAMTVTNRGRVGIGTTNPGSALEVEGGDASVTTQGKGVILRATDGSNCYRLTVDNSGTLSTASVTCP